MENKSLTCHTTSERRLIYANALLAEYDRVHIGEPGKARKLIEDAPTVDAVEVVRCEKCCYSQALPTNIESAFGVGVKHCQKRRGNNTNPFGLSTVSRDDFCSYGERREGE